MRFETFNKKTLFNCIYPSRLYDAVVKTHFVSVACIENLREKNNIRENFWLKNKGRTLSTALD
jgi:hypothetical protein